MIILPSAFVQVGRIILDSRVSEIDFNLHLYISVVKIQLFLVFLVLKGWISESFLGNVFRILSEIIIIIDFCGIDPVIWSAYNS